VENQNFGSWFYVIVRKVLRLNVKKWRADIRDELLAGVLDAAACS
jgi:hypothetical protein